MAIFHVFFAFLPSVLSFYDSTSPVVKLTSDNFRELVLLSPDLWLVEFYAPWCGHCKKLAPEFEKAANALQGIAKLGAVDMTTDASAGSDYNIQGYPTLKFFGDSKSSPTEYDSGRNAKDISTFLLRQAQLLVNKRLGVKVEVNTEEKKVEEAPEEPVNEDDVITLTESNFDEEVFSGDDLWMIDFHAPWCSHCKKLTPDWAKAATLLKGSVKFAKVNAIDNQKLSEKYKIKSYPTIIVFAPGKEPEDYTGGRDFSIMIKFALEKLDELGKVPKIVQWTSQNVLNTTCDEMVCILVFLPHIYDSSAVERNRYIGVIQEAFKKNRGKPVRFLWAQAGDFAAVEKLTGVGFGFPAVVGISLKKNRFALMTSSFNFEELHVFIKKLLSGKVPLVEYKKLPEIETVTEWDGADYQQEYLEDL